MEITPTLVIGIGGTGKKVIMEIKKQLFESYGLRKSTTTYDEHLGYPVIQFLSIDTDTADSKNIFENNYNNAVVTAPDNMQLKTHEFLAATIDSDIYRLYKQNLSGYPYISSWMPQEVMDKNSPKIVSEGAGQHRLFARLCFFHNFNNIKSKILEKLEIINKMVLTKNVWSTMLNPEVALPFNPDTNKHHVNIYIVTSLAGGTGCGMFLDVSMLTKNLLGTNSLNNLECRIDNIALLPSGYIGQKHDNKDRIFANAYAALKEVELLSFKSNSKHPLAYPGSDGTSFVQWTANNSDKYQITGGNDSPWDIFYLVDVQNSHSQISNASCIKMVADRIFLNFDNSALPAKLRSLVSNIENSANILHLYKNSIKDAARNPIVEKVSSQKYGTFGLSSYKYDRENLKRRAAHVLGERLCGFILTKTSKDNLNVDDIFKLASSDIGDGPLDIDDFNNFNPDNETLFSPNALFYLLLSTTKENIINYLDGSLTGSFKKHSYLNFQEQLDSLLKKLNSSESISQGGSSNSLEDAHNNLLKIVEDHNKRLQVIPDHTSTPGVNIPKEIKANCKHIINYIPQFVKKFLLRNVTEFGVDLTLLILEKIVDKLNVWRDFNKEVNKINEDSYALGNFDYRIKDAKKIILPWFRNVATGYEIKRVESDLISFLEEKYYRSVSDSIEQIYSVLLKTIAESEKQEKISAIRATNKFKTLFDLNNNTNDSLREIFKKKFLELDGIKSNTQAQGVQDNRVVFALDEDRWDEDRFKREIGAYLNFQSFENIDRQKFSEIEKDFLVKFKEQTPNLGVNFSLGDLQNHMFEFNSLITGLSQTSTFKIDIIYGSIINACMGHLANFANNILVSENLEKGNVDLKISNLALYSYPYLVKASELREDSEINDRWQPSTQLVAYKQSALDLKIKLEGVPYSNFTKLEPIKMADDSIVVYQDMLGFPLSSISVIKDLGDAYHKLSKINVELHLDKQFQNYSPDLRPILSSAYPKFINTFSNVINGIILGSLELYVDSSSYMLNDSLTTSIYKFTLVLDRLVDCLFLDSKLNDILEKKNKSCFSKMDFNVTFGYWVCLQKLWVDLHYAKKIPTENSTDKHPVIYLLDYILLPHIVNHKNEVFLNNPEYDDILKMVNDIKKSTQLDRKLFNSFNIYCEKYFNAPSDEALNLVNYFPIHTLKF